MCQVMGRKLGKFGIICVDYGVWGARESCKELGGSGAGGSRSGWFLEKPIGYLYIYLMQSNSAVHVTRENQMLKALWRWLTHYKVVVQWEDRVFVHYGYTLNEALQWAAQYKLSNTVVLIGIRGKLVAARGDW